MHEGQPLRQALAPPVRTGAVDRRGLALGCDERLCGASLKVQTIFFFFCAPYFWRARSFHVTLLEWSARHSTRRAREGRVRTTIQPTCALNEGGLRHSSAIRSAVPVRCGGLDLLLVWTRLVHTLKLETFLSKPRQYRALRRGTLGTHVRCCSFWILPMRVVQDPCGPYRARSGTCMHAF